MPRKGKKEKKKKDSFPFMVKAGYKAGLVGVVRDLHFRVKKKSSLKHNHLSTDLKKAAAVMSRF